jgi:hypothetical protein
MKGDAMTKNSLSVFKCILFLLGAGIVFLAFKLNTGGQELTRDDGFMWISIAVMYLVVFLPFFFSSIRIGNFSVKIPSLAMVWTGVFLYVPASVVVIVLLRNGIISFNTALIIQAVLVFLFALDVYFGYFANFHIGSVEREEASLRQYLTEIKSKALSLALASGGLSAEYGKVQNTLKQALDDIKYITPVQNNAGTDIEIKIISALDSIKLLCGTISEGAHPSSFESEINKLQMLVKERKLLRN